MAALSAFTCTVILREGIGNGIGVDWHTFIQGWEVAWRVLDYVATAGGAAWVLKTVPDRVKDRLGRGLDALDRNVHRWAQRGAWPYTFDRFLERDSWRSHDLGRLLGCPHEDAEAISRAVRFRL